MEPFEIIALVGAFAWLPHLINLAKAALTKPEIRIIAEKSAEIGFTTLGPILNLRVAFAVKHKDIVVSGVRIRVRHESGEERLFSWHGVTQRMLQMNTQETGPIPFEKELTVLAVKLSPKDIEERSIRFQDSNYHDEKATFEAKAAKKLNHMQATNEIDYEGFLKSEELADLISFIKRSYSWKSGNYTAKFEIDAPEAFSLLQDFYEFSLTAIDVEHIEKNKDSVEKYFETQIQAAKDGSTAEKIVWNWRYPSFRSAT